MSAEPILYCLERLTDYRQLERLASDIMIGVGYKNLEPIGGTGDRGRDALHVSRVDRRTSIFAYSARTDWETKFAADLNRIQQLDDQPDEVVFVSTREIGAQKKDVLRANTKEEFGWDVDFYDCERLRVQLAGPQSELLAQHPAIFVPPWFERRGGELVTQTIPNLIVIDHVEADQAAATWLYRKLTTIGWSAWCAGHAPLAGEDVDQSIRRIIAQRAIRYLPLLSNQGVQNSALVARCSVAAAQESRVIPCWLDDVSDVAMDPNIARIEPAAFYESWSDGLFALQAQLTHAGVEKTLSEDSLGKALALQAYQPEPVLIDQSEPLYANVFPVTVPDKIWAFRLEDPDAELNPSYERTWPHYRRGPWIFAFEPPKPRLPELRWKPHQYAWRDHPKKHEADSTTVVKVLVKRALFVACRQKGFEWCDERHTFYLDEPLKTRHGFQQVDGSFSSVSFSGHRTIGSGEYKSECHYQLGPIFRVHIDDGNVVTVMLRFYVRLTNPDGTVIENAKIPSRRKRVTKNWWNRQWLQRTIAMMQHICIDGADINGELVIGKSRRAVRVGVKPLSWDCPVGINMAAMSRIGDFGEELAAAREIDEPEEPAGADG